MPIIFSVLYLMLNSPNDAHQKCYGSSLVAQARILGINVTLNHVPTLIGGQRSAFRVAIKAATSSTSEYDAIVVGSHGCDLFTASGTKRFVLLHRLTSQRSSHAP